MNCIRRIGVESAVTAFVNFPYIVYFFLLSECHEEDGGVYCDYTKDELETKFRGVKPGVVEEALSRLESDGLVKAEDFDGDVYYLVGTESEGGKVALLNPESSESVSVFQHQLEAAVESYISDATGVQKAMARALKSSVDQLHEKKLDRYEHRDFVALWLYAYEAFFQDRPREFMQKEHGQMKQLRTTYEPEVLYKMIVYYMQHSEKWGKAPSLNILQYRRDEIYLQMRGKTKSAKSKTHMRTRRSEDSGF